MLNSKIGYIICETASEPSKPIILSEKNNRVTIDAKLQDANVRNRNGRYYADGELFPELKSDRIIELVESGNMFGEAGHPNSKDIARQQTIDPNNVSHKITKLWTEGNDVRAYVRGSANRIGEDFNNHILDGTKVSFSLRALGTVNNTKRGAEVQNIKIITWDWVIYPSHKTAYMDKIVNLNESAMLGGDNGNKLQLEQNDAGIFVPITNQQVNDYIRSESANLKSVLESFDMLYESIDVVDNGKRVRMTDKSGNAFMINLESYIQNEIMNYCFK